MLTLKRCRLLAASAMVAMGWLAAVSRAALPIEIVAERESGIFKAGEPARWTVTWKAAVGTTQPAAPSELKYSVKKNAFTVIKEGTLPGAGGIVETTLDEPGAVMLEVKAVPLGGKEITGLAGAVFEPEKIRVPTTRPADFDQFWDRKIAELNAIPMTVQLEPMQSGKEGVDAQLITLNNINNTHIRGVVFTPILKEGQAKVKHPALLVVQWAGVYGLHKEYNNWRASDGWIVMNIEAHDIPPFETPAFYKDLEKGALNGYASIGNDDRETSYFLRMYLGCYRAAEYLTTRDDWDGKTLVVTGNSQGGMQTFVTAALHPKVTAGIAGVPAGADQNGPAQGRLPGWPQWYWQTKGKDEAKVRATGQYFDIMFMADRIKCPMLVATGGIDTTCASFGVIAATNEVPGRHELVYMPRSHHQGPDDAQKEWQARSATWFKALQSTGAPPAP